MYTRELPKIIKTIFPEAICSTAVSVAQTITAPGPVTVFCTTGTVWINPTTTATTANGFKLSDTAGFNFIELRLPLPGELSLVADTTTAKFQAISWDY